MSQPAAPREVASQATPPELLSAADALVAGLVASGVREVFGIAGGKFAPLLAAIAREPRLRWIGTRHEAAAAFMATAVSHRTGRLAACVAEMGPGALNLASGLDTANTNHLPVLAITVGTPARLSAPAHGILMELDAPTLFSSVTKWHGVVAHPERIAELMARATREAFTNAPGPVHLEVGYDVLGAPAACSADSLRAVGAALELGRAPADPELVPRAAQLLADARQPLVIAGGGVVAAEASDELRSLVRRLDAPGIVTQMGIGTLASDDPHLVGQGGVVFGESVLRALRQADVVLAVGCRFSSWLWDGAHPGGSENPDQKLIHVDRDPTVPGRLRPAAVGLVGDARAVLGQLLSELAGELSSADPNWREELRVEHLAYRAQLRALGIEADDPARPMHPAQLARALGDAIAPEALVVYDGAHTSFWSNDLTPVAQPRTRFHDPGSGHLGFGVPYAHALALLEPGRPVIDITGDGAFGFSVAELDTAVRYGLAVVHVIHDNQAWGVIRHSQARLRFELGTGLQGTDYAAIARGFGAHGERVGRPEDVAPALARALATGGPAVIDCRTEFVPHPGLPRFGAMGREAS
jgi:thiamine pyrophosphate-dependent acetolactate synthase large subunit-like protein